MGLVWGELSSLVKGNLYIDVDVEYPEKVEPKMIHEMTEMVNRTYQINPDHFQLEKMGNVSATMSDDIIAKYNDKVMQSIQFEKKSECKTM